MINRHDIKRYAWQLFAELIYGEGHRDRGRETVFQ